MTSPDTTPASRKGVGLILALIAAFTLALTLHGYLSRPSLDRWGDMYENYAWGVLWQWGYFKHPPFFAWETAAWFELFPRNDFNYFLLAGVNAGVALLALWRIAARFGGTGFQVLVLVLAMLMPPISLQGLNFNANSAMTPLWALLFLFYLSGLERGRMIDAVLIGLIAACAMLTKYHSAVMLGALFIHALVDGEARRLLFSKFGLVVVIVFVLVFSPHLYWLIDNDFRPISYAAHQDGDEGSSLADSFHFLLTPIGYTALAVLVARLMRDWRDWDPLLPLAGVRSPRNTVQGSALIAFAVLPMPLTILLGYAANAELSAVWGIPFYTAYAIILALLVPERYYEPRQGRALIAGGLFMAILILVAPVWYRYERFNGGGGYYNAPLAAIGAEVDKRWIEAGGGEGGLLFGKINLSNAVSFYMPSRPITLEGNSFDIAKGYLTLEQARKRGLIGLCSQGDQACRAEVEATMPNTVKPSAFSLPGLVPDSTWAFDLWLAPPQR